MLSNHIDLHHSQTLAQAVELLSVLSNHIDLHHSQTNSTYHNPGNLLSSIEIVDKLLSNHIDLHHSQTYVKVVANGLLLSNHIDLHHSQTIARSENMSKS